MTDAPLLRRIDEHLAHSNGHMARGNELMEEIRAEHRLNSAALQELRDVTRSAVLPLERLSDRLDDMGDQIRANTEATWRMLERLGPGPQMP